jgi:hypothetical protein
VFALVGFDLINVKSVLRGFFKKAVGLKFAERKFRVVAKRIGRGDEVEVRVGGAERFDFHAEVRLRRGKSRAFFNVIRAAKTLAKIKILRPLPDSLKYHFSQMLVCGQNVDDG